MDGGKYSADKEIKLPDCPADMHIIVVDDDSTCLRAMSGLLKDLNYQVVPFHSATDALYALRSNAVLADLVLTDIHMPIMNGIEFMEVIRREFQLPVILMSEDDDRRFIADSISKGALFYVLKPGKLSEDSELKYLCLLLRSWKRCRLLTRHQKIPDLRPSEGAMASEEVSMYLTNAYFHLDFLDCIECLEPQNVTLEGFCQLLDRDELITDDVALHLQVYRACLEDSENQTNVIPLANPVQQVGNNQWAGDATQAESCGSCSWGGDDECVADINGHVGDHSVTSKAESGSAGGDD